MDTLSFKEDHNSQITALQELINLDYAYLSTTSLKGKVIKKCHLFYW